MICGKCGGNDAYRLPPDYIDWCDDCGVIEGLDNKDDSDKLEGLIEALKDVYTGLKDINDEYERDICNL